MIIIYDHGFWLWSALVTEAHMETEKDALGDAHMETDKDALDDAHLDECWRAHLAPRSKMKSTPRDEEVTGFWKPVSEILQLSGCRRRDKDYNIASFPK